MNRIEIVAAAGRYDVLVGRGLLASVGKLLCDAGLRGNVKLVADEQVHHRYGGALEERLREDDFKVSTFRVQSGESSKSLKMASRIYDWLVETGTERRDLLIALGGGVVGDLAGFVAATFLRGLRFVQLPTSLLAQVDSSVGGKVAVNHPRGKNLIGAFYPPSLVVADTDTLATLPARELSAAMAEIIKTGVILDSDLFQRLERDVELLLGLKGTTMDEVIGRCIELKVSVVGKDEKEAGLRAILNYGHTIGHAVEAVTSYTSYKHGEAVAVGMVGAAEVAVRIGMLKPDVARRQKELLRMYRLPTSCPGLDAEQLLEAMGHDKKLQQGKLTWVLPDGIGKVDIKRDVPLEVVREVLQSLVTE
ncbi:MAG: 3-dehydroquinate synthase [Chloroflexota bacterium]|jgi:3-dehydroquinate synthase